MPACSYAKRLVYEGVTTGGDFWDRSMEFLEFSDIFGIEFDLLKFEWSGVIVGVVHTGHPRFLWDS